MNSILLIGSGGCGNKLLETGLTIIEESYGIGNSYDSVFINSNLNEMNIMKHFKMGENGLYISGQGTGRDREIAKISIIKDKSKFFNYLNPKAPNYNLAVILISTDGGFGSGSIETISRVLKQSNPSIKILLVGAMPKYNSRKISIENACLLHKDVIELMKDDNHNIIDSLIYIKNEKMKDIKIDDEEVKSIKQSMKNDDSIDEEYLKRFSDKETKFNFKVMEQLIHALDLHGGSVDVSDTFKTITAKGYALILPVSNEDKTLTDAVDKSITDSPFVLPAGLPKKTEEESLVTCSHLVGIYDDKFEVDEWQKMFDVTTFDKNDYSGNDNSLIFANGFNMPTAFMNMLKSNLEKLKTKIKNSNKDSSFEFSVSKDEEDIISSDIVEEVKSNTNTEIKTEPKSNKSSVQKALEKRKQMGDLFKNIF